MRFAEEGAFLKPSHAATLDEAEGSLLGVIFTGLTIAFSFAVSANKCTTCASDVAQQLYQGFLIFFEEYQHASRRQKQARTIFFHFDKPHGAMSSGRGLFQLNPVSLFSEN